MLEAVKSLPGAARSDAAAEPGALPMPVPTPVYVPVLAPYFVALPVPVLIPHPLNILQAAYPAVAIAPVPVVEAAPAPAAIPPVPAMVNAPVLVPALVNAPVHVPAVVNAPVPAAVSASETKAVVASHRLSAALIGQYAIAAIRSVSSRFERSEVSRELVRQVSSKIGATAARRTFGWSYGRVARAQEDKKREARTRLALQPVTRVPYRDLREEVESFYRRADNAEPFIRHDSKENRSYEYYIARTTITALYARYQREKLQAKTVPVKRSSFFRWQPPDWCAASLQKCVCTICRTAAETYEQMSTTIVNMCKLDPANEQEWKWMRDAHPPLRLLVRQAGWTRRPCGELAFGWRRPPCAAGCRCARRTPPARATR
jgi:hypothetical protein